MAMRYVRLRCSELEFEPVTLPGGVTEKVSTVLIFGRKDCAPITSGRRPLAHCVGRHAAKEKGLHRRPFVVQCLGAECTR